MRTSGHTHSAVVFRRQERRENLEVLLERPAAVRGQSVGRARLAVDERLLEVDVAGSLEDAEVPREVPVGEPEERAELEVVDLPPRRERRDDREPHALVDD